jgi:hypothetical protein
MTMFSAALAEEPWFCDNEFEDGGWALVRRVPQGAVLILQYDFS